MELHELVTPECVLAKVNVSSKKQLLQELARHAAKHLRSCDAEEFTQDQDTCERELLEVLLERERLGSTGVGHGIAIPHGRLDSLKSIHGIFALLEKPVEFDSIDDQPVDMIFLLLAPSNAGAEHLKALAQISRMLRNQGLCERLRGCEDPDALFALLTGEPATNAA